MLMQWDQNAPFNSIESSAELSNLIKSISELDPGINDYVEAKVKETFKSKRVLNFPAQIAIFRKMWMIKHLNHA